MSGDLKPPGDNPDYMLYIHDGFRVVYTIEEQPTGFYHHISISIDRKKKHPNEIAVKIILDAFDMKKTLKDSKIWVEKKTQSVNILQRIDKNYENASLYKS